MALDQDAVYTALRSCRDPEIPVNIVDLGLVYGVDIQPPNLTTEGAAVTIRMTLTSTGCPMSHSIAAEVQRTVAALAGVGTARVEIVWEPAWSPALISEQGRRQLQLAS
jgi:metal-sulfur cluster biosynthetic enzyme